MTQWDFMAAMLEKFGLPGAVLAVLAWAIYRFGARPVQAGQSGGSGNSPALEKISAKIDAMQQEMTDRLARVETEIANIKGQRR